MIDPQTESKLRTKAEQLAEEFFRNLGCCGPDSMERQEFFDQQVISALSQRVANQKSLNDKLTAAGLRSVKRMVGRCLDLYCCEGGAGMGYALAGYQVTGVDIKPMPRYPQTFVLGDALEYLEAHGSEYDLIHASPPCQGYSNLTPRSHRDNHARMIPAVRELLEKVGKPYVIENVAGARHELRHPLMLCGTMFGLRTQRHRYFETNFRVTAPAECDHSVLPLLVTTASKSSRAKRHALGMKPKTVKNAPAAYGIGWMSCEGLKEAIPPAYTRYIGICAANDLAIRQSIPE